MNIQNLYQSGISSTKTRFVINPLRGLLFRLLKPYFSMLIQYINDSFESVSRRTDAVNKDLEAMSYRFNTVEIKLQDNLSYSKSGEDRIISTLFERLGIPPRDVRYLDISSGCSIKNSNTYLFYKAGASGCLVMADPDLLVNALRQRPSDMIIQGSVIPKRLNNTSGTTPFLGFRANDEPLIKDEGLSIVEKPGKARSETMDLRVPAMTIEDILLLEVHNNGIDLMSINIREHEAEVIKEMDFAVQRPRIIVCQNHFNQEQNDIDCPAKDFLVENGYQPYASTYLNSIFIDTSLIKNSNFSRLE